jgi:hypothetical protein
MAIITNFNSTADRAIAPPDAAARDPHQYQEGSYETVP